MYVNWKEIKCRTIFVSLTPIKATLGTFPGRIEDKRWGKIHICLTFFINIQ